MMWTAERLAACGLTGPRDRVLVPGPIQHVAGLLTPWLESRGERTALVGRHRRLTFRELDSEVRAAASYLSALGAVEGTRIAASLRNHPEIVVAFLAAQRIGAIWVGINLAYAPLEKHHMMVDSGVSLLLAEPDVIETLLAADALPGDVRTVTVTPGGDSEWARGIAAHAGAPDNQPSIDLWAPGGIAYTSGTTGRPKGAVHSQHNMIVAAVVTERLAGYRADDAVRATASPLTILNMMIGGPLATLAAGNTHVCCDRIDVPGLAEWIRRERINSMALVPTLIRDLLTAPDIAADDLASLKWVVIGAAMVPEGMSELYAQRFGHAPSIGYGLTEAPTVVSRSHDGTPAVQGAIGRPAPHLEVAILDGEGNAVPAGVPGEICVRARTNGEWAGVYTPPLGYWRKPEATAALLCGGWLHTGDIGRIDADGELFIDARRSDLIVRGGANIYPAEIERVLLQHSQVRDCAVIGAPDERLGEVPVAYVEADATIDGPALIEAMGAECLRQLARYKLPVRWHVLPAFPRNAMGKIIRHALPSAERTIS